MFVLRHDFLTSDLGRFISIELPTTKSVLAVLAITPLFVLL
jgi:hypothetical protein